MARRRGSSSVNGDCSDVGATYPTSGQVIGRVLSTNVGAGTYAMIVFPTEIDGAGAGGGTMGTVTIVQGKFMTQSGTCSSGSAINCTVGANFLGGSLATAAGSL